MKKSLLLLSLIAIAANTASFAEEDLFKRGYATPNEGLMFQDNSAKTICEKWVSNYNDVHCTYVTGLESNTNIGRYIKHYDSNQDISYTRCVTADTVEDDIFQGVAEYYVGIRRVEYSICSDAKAESCEPLGTDAFNIINDGDKYFGTPSTYAINLTAVKDRYPSCIPINPSLKHILSFAGKKH
ncbi:MAG TPA: hypothetical protein VLH77_06460 [Gammaproteobacteria bacterium]|nr:hypothetical protein [Gammaproteobacteria bacterium]